MFQDNLLVWLPSPMCDAVLCTPTLRSIRKHFNSARITFLASKPVQQVLSDCSFNDEWIVSAGKDILPLAAKLRKCNFTSAILLKNSFGSALIVFLAGIENRIGYSRQGRGFLLTDRLYPSKLAQGKYQPLSMIDYYLSVASWLGADTSDRRIELSVADDDVVTLKKKLPQISDANKPLVILVPGGAFGLSKCWPAERFAQAANYLVEKHNANVIISVSPQKAEKQIANQIFVASKQKLINLAENPLTLGELKALFSKAALVICNDTGPRHIAIALDRRVITLFGPNDPAWTQTGHEKEVQIIGRAPCAPCRKPTCSKSEHICMNSITVQRVCAAAKRFLKGENTEGLSDTAQQFVQLSDSCFVDKDYKDDFCSLGLTTIDSIFAFQSGRNLTKKNLADYRTRIQLQIGTPTKTLFLKRYENPPLNAQMDKVLCNHAPITCGIFEVNAAKTLTAAGVNTAKVIAYGEQTNWLFENRSFVITEQVPAAKSLEQKLPHYFDAPVTGENLPRRRKFINDLAEFIKAFHYTGFCHRDLYLCHIFCDENEKFTLIDLARAFQPWLLRPRYRIKDIAQLFYSAPGKYFSQADRLRFYKTYRGRKKLTTDDKTFIRKVVDKVNTMAAHDEKHGRNAPFKQMK